MRFRIEEYHYKVCTVVDPIFKTLHAATLQKNMCMVIVFEAFFRTIPCYGENSYLHMSVITILGPSASEVPCKICDLKPVMCARFILERSGPHVQKKNLLEHNKNKKKSELNKTNVLIAEAGPYFK